MALENVPYGADVQEILKFFSGFELNSRDVVKRFNDSGKLSGEVLVNLRNPQEAMRAVRVLQNKFIFNRPVLSRSSETLSFDYCCCTHR